MIVVPRGLRSACVRVVMAASVIAGSERGAGSGAAVPDSSSPQAGATASTRATRNGVSLVMRA